MKKYDSYKDSGIEWIGEIPGHWEVKKIKYLASINDDGLSDKTDEEYELEYVDISSIESGVGITKSEVFKFKDAPSRARRIVKHGDIIVSTVRTYLKAIAKIDNPKPNLIVSTGFAVVRPKDITPEYSGYLFYHENLLGEIVSRSVGVSYPAINSSEIGTIKIPLPQKSEQTAIAHYLDRKTAEIDELIADKKRLLELYEEEKTAIINQAVTKGLNPDLPAGKAGVPMKDSGIEWLGEIPEHWEVKRLRYLCKVTTGDKDTENREDDGGYPFYVRSQTVERISTYSFDGEGILTAGDGVGVCKVWHYVNEKFDFHQRVYLLYDFQEIFGKFLFYYIKQNFIHDVLRLSAKSTVDSLRRNMFLDFQVVFPIDYEEQQSIVRHIETECARIDAKKAKTEKLIALLTEYRTALISEVVTGKVKVIP